MLFLTGLLVGYGWGSLWWWARAQGYRRQLSQVQAQLTETEQASVALVRHATLLTQRTDELAAAFAVYGTRHQRGN